MRRLSFLRAFTVLPLSALLIWFSAATASGQEKHTWTYDRGRWSQVREESSPQATDPVIVHAQEELAHGDPASARDRLLQWEHAHKDSTLRDQAVFLIAQSYVNDEDGILAFYYFDEVMDEYPESRLFAQCLQRQYDIADNYLSGHKRKFLGLSIISANDEAVEMLYRIQVRSPGSSVAERALLRTADYYFAAGQYDFAADAYGHFASAYPRSTHTPRARIREAFALVAQFRGVRFDATPVIEARLKLIKIKSEFPALAEEENVQAVIDNIDRALADKLLVSADFYERTGVPASAAFYYKFLIQTYPQSSEAAQARKKLARLPAQAQAGINAPHAAGYGTSQPTDNASASPN